MTDWSTFGSDARKHVSHPSGPKCRMAVTLESLPDDGRKAVVKALENKALTNTSIRKALKDRLGEDAPTIWSIGNHRRGNCRCSG